MIYANGVAGILKNCAEWEKIENILTSFIDNKRRCVYHFQVEKIENTLIFNHKAVPPEKSVVTVP